MVGESRSTMKASYQIALIATLLFAMAATPTATAAYSCSPGWIHVPVRVPAPGL